MGVPVYQCTRKFEPRVESRGSLDGLSEIFRISYFTIVLWYVGTLVHYFYNIYLNLIKLM